MPIGRPNPFSKVRNAERRYSAQLRKVAKHVDDLVRGLSVGTLEQSIYIQQLLQNYASLISPWARAVGARMLEDVSQRDLRAWSTYTKEFGSAMQREIRDSPTGLALQEYLREQVDLITSLPREAAERVHKLTLQGMSEGSRGTEIISDILRTGEVTRSRATLIARTECARAASGLTMIRAKQVGSDGYIWRTMKDKAVRPTHKVMEGKFIRWDSPPEVDPGKHYHAGSWPNCRCYSEPVLPDVF